VGAGPHRRAPALQRVPAPAQGRRGDEISIADNTIQGSLKQPLQDGRQKFVTTRVDPSLAKDLAQYDVKFTGIVENTFFKDLLGWVLPAVIFVGIWIFAMKKFAGKQGWAAVS
jgi:cell division protease FtsH